MAAKPKSKAKSKPKSAPKPKSKAKAKAKPQVKVKASAPAAAEFTHLGLSPATAAAMAAIQPAAVPGASTLELKVSKQAGPVATSITVGSPGLPDTFFDDNQLTPGPARMQMLAGHHYTAVWQGAFVANGKATLHVLATDAAGNPTLDDSVDAVRPPLGKVFVLGVF